MMSDERRPAGFRLRIFFSLQPSDFGIPSGIRTLSFLRHSDFGHSKLASTPGEMSNAQSPKQNRNPNPRRKPEAITKTESGQQGGRQLNDFPPHSSFSVHHS
jgi:hypothetical protein